MSGLIILALTIVFLVCAWLLFGKKRKRRSKHTRRKHQTHVAIASTVLTTINEIIKENPKPVPVVLAYLRKIDPFVFEELLLTCFERQGYKICRNQRYTGDGGVDGYVWLHGQKYLVQAKRYKDAINPAHLQEFAQVIAHRQASGGFFVHTGRTGNKSKSVLQQHPEIELLSGHKLVNFIGRG